MGLLQEVEVAPFVIAVLLFVLVASLILPPLGLKELSEATTLTELNNASLVVKVGLSAYVFNALAAIVLWRLVVRRMKLVSLPRFGSSIAGEKFIHAFLRNRAGPLSTLILGGISRRAQSVSAEDENLQTDTVASSPRAMRANARGDLNAPTATRIVLIVVESFRADVLRHIPTARKYIPTIHAMSGEGANFLHHYSNSSHSDYADVAILNGKYPEFVGRRAKRRDPDREPLVYEELARAGFSCAFFSSQDETWGGMYDRLRSLGLSVYFHAGPGGTAGDGLGATSASTALIRKRRHGGKFDDADTTMAAIDWLEKNQKEKTFLILNLQSTHVPFYAPDHFLQALGTTVPTPKLRFARFSVHDATDVWMKYLISLSYVDLQIRKLVNAVSIRGSRETVILITGDTGQAFYEHGFCCHGSSLFNEVIHVPLLISAADRTPPQVPLVTQHVDIAPTILDLAGIPIPSTYDGLSIFSRKNSSQSGVAYSICETPLANEVAAIAGPWKTIIDRRLGEYFLYDLTLDPGELSDCKHSHAARLQEGIAQIHAFLTRQAQHVEKY